LDVKICAHFCGSLVTVVAHLAVSIPSGPGSLLVSFQTLGKAHPFHVLRLTIVFRWLVVAFSIPPHPFHVFRLTIVFRWLEVAFSISRPQTSILVLYLHV